MMVHRNLLILHILMWNVVRIDSSHFYGGTVTWKPINNTASGATIDVMFTQSYQWRRSWTNGGSSGYCDQTTILNKSPLIPSTSDTLACVTGSCGGYTSISINEYCTDFSTLMDTSSGQTSTVRAVNVGSYFCVAYRDSAWIRVLSTNCAGNASGLCFDSGADWSIGTCINLTMRSGGFINTPPVATVISRTSRPTLSLDTISKCALFSYQCDDWYDDRDSDTSDWCR